MIYILPHVMSCSARGFHAVHAGIIVFISTQYSAMNVGFNYYASGLGSQLAMACEMESYRYV